MGKSEKESAALYDQEPEIQVAITGVVIDCDRLNVREAPKMDAAVVCTIPRDTEVTIDKAESARGFYKVCLVSGIEGFCAKQYISINR